MNFYKHHLGDYSKDTAHLSISEHGAYRLLLDYYYSTESPLPDSLEALCRICRAITLGERAAVASIRRQFFEARDGLLFNDRAEMELGEYKQNADKSRKNGSLGGRPGNKTQKEPSGFLNGNPDETQRVLKTKPRRNPEGTQSITQSEPRRNLSQNPLSRTVSMSVSKSDTIQADGRPPAAGDTPSDLVSLEEAIQSRLAPADCTSAWWHEQAARGWRDKHGQPLLNWRAALQGFAAKWAANERPAGGKCPAKSDGPKPTAKRLGREVVTAPVRPQDRATAEEIREAKKHIAQPA